MGFSDIVWFVEVESQIAGQLSKVDGTFNELRLGQDRVLALQIFLV